MKQINTYIYNIKHIKNYINEKLRLTAKRTYTCQPKNKNELREIILQRIENEGNECDLNDIDTSKIINMSYLFDSVKLRYFNGDISLWDVSNVKNMGFIFFGCKKFNCDLSKWNVSNVEDMACMFYGCEKFNQDLDSWDVSKVKNMYHTFEDCPTQPEWYNKDKWGK